MGNAGIHTAIKFNVCKDDFLHVFRTEPADGREASHGALLTVTAGHEVTGNLRTLSCRAYRCAHALWVYRETNKLGAAFDLNPSIIQSLRKDLLNISLPRERNV